MRLLVQRVSQASVAVDSHIISRINKGYVVLLGIHSEDTPNSISKLCRKLLSLRLFPDEEAHMNRSIKDCHGDILVVSQFSLYADCTKGARPNFIKSAKGDKALPLYEAFVAQLEADYPHHIYTGQFAAHMKVQLTNDGPVTLMLED